MVEDDCICNEKVYTLLISKVDEDYILPLFHKTTVHLLKDIDYFFKIY